MDNTNSTWPNWSISSYLKKSTPFVLLALTALGLLIYTTLRAANLSMTHDESGSFTIWSNYPIFKCFLSPDCWGTANLHWLFVFLMQPSVKLFGESELAVRLPSLLAHFIYLWFSFRLVKFWSPNSWIALVGFLLLNLNPFLLDFFSLARGYGLAMACMMFSIYNLGRYADSGRNSPMVWSLIGGILSVLANFTMLIYFACLLAILGLIALAKAYFSKKQLWNIALTALGSMALLSALLFVPIKTLMGKGEFEYGVESFWGTFQSLVKTSLYGVKYMSMYHVEVFGGICVLLLSAGLLFAIGGFMKNPKDGKQQFYLGASLLPLFATLITIAQHYLLGTQYLVNRTALLFIPLTALSVFLLFAFWEQKERNRAWKILPAIIGIFTIVHLARGGQMKYTSEWYYDFNTKEVVTYLDETLPPDTKIKFGMHWLFHPTATFYFKTLHLDYADTLIYSKELRTDSFYDYYYVPNEDFNNLHPDYILDKLFPGTGFLMKRQ